MNTHKLFKRLQNQTKAYARTAWQAGWCIQANHCFDRGKPLFSLCPACRKIRGYFQYYHRFPFHPYPRGGKLT